MYNICHDRVLHLRKRLHLMFDLDMHSLLYTTIERSSASENLCPNEAQASAPKGETRRASYENHTLAGSKLRTSALGPELVVVPEFQSVPVKVTIERAGAALWAKPFCTGESAMRHSLQNMEHHHFKFEIHRRPGGVHVHSFGTACLGFSDGVRLQEGDVMKAAMDRFERPFRNPVRVARSNSVLTAVIPLG
jgi:hypothetical protein